MPNLSQLKRERMLAFLQKIKDEHRDDDDMLIALGEIESELTFKKYGLVWEQHEEAVDVMMRDNIPVFTEVPEREITAAPGQGYNFILEGDNLHSLRLLEKTHKGRIDMIYIDPPYNTGNKDFRYDDSYVSKEDGYFHSKWISFMEHRLRMARNLLSDEGILFISINDIEQANLQLLCNEIFGSDNHIGTFIWKNRKALDSRNKTHFSNNHEYVIVFAKNVEFATLVGKESSMDKYSNPDNDPRGIWLSCSMLGLANAQQRPNLHYDLTNAYHEYTSGFATSLVRSTCEMLFEQHCESRQDIEWVYKNGDTGQQYFSIVYVDGIQHQWLFYADYIVMKKDGTVWVIETKGGEARGQDKNIDRQIENKFNAFKAYAAKHNLHWGFVRDKDNQLYINNTEFAKDMADDHWVPLTQEF